MIRMRKSLGQNFLTNRAIAKRIASSVPEGVLNDIVEIGPGRGILTEELLKRGARVISIEIDTDMAPYLNPLRKSYPKNLSLIWGNALGFIDRFVGEPTFIVSNLPFSISSSFFYGICDRILYRELSRTSFLGGVVMVQEEFGRRLLSGPGSKDYGKLSISFGSKMKSDTFMMVKRGNFDPVPDVDAMVITFEPRREIIKYPLSETLFHRILEISFSKRRKKIKNSIHPSALGLDIEYDQFIKILDELGLSDKRPEDIDFLGFKEITDLLTTIRPGTVK